MRTFRIILNKIFEMMPFLEQDSLIFTDIYCNDENIKNSKFMLILYVQTIFRSLICNWSVRCKMASPTDIKNKLELMSD